MILGLIVIFVLHELGRFITSKIVKGRFLYFYNGIRKNDDFKKIIWVSIGGLVGGMISFLFWYTPLLTWAYIVIFGGWDAYNIIYCMRRLL